MTLPQGPILGAVHLNDGLNAKFDWQRSAGLSDTSQVMPGSIQQTFDGPFRVAPMRQTRPQRDVLLAGYLYHSGGLAEGWSRLLSVQQLVTTPTAVLQVGGLGLDIVPASLRPERFKATLGTALDYVTTVTAVPGTWRALYGSAKGAAYGMTANAESLINLAAAAPSGQVVDTSAFALAAGASPAVTNGGTAPTPLVLTISGRTTRFYVRCTAPGYARRISVTPVNGVAEITEDMGLYVPPGASVLRYEEASGALITGTIASSIYGTRWRWDGLAVAEATREPVILYNTRQMRAYAATSAFTTSAGLTLYGPDVPRFGNSGTYDAADAGLVVEPDRTNLVLQSIALTLSPWTTTGTVTRSYGGSAPDGTSTSTQVVFTAGAAGTLSQASITLTAAPYVISFYARGTGSFTVSLLSGGSGLLAQVITPGTNWARYQYLMTGTAAAYTLTFADNALAACDVQLWGVQVELASGQTAANATSFIPTTTTTQRRVADIVGVRRLENLAAWSNRFDKTTGTSTTRGLWYVAGGTVTTATLQAGPSGVTDAATLTAAGAVAGIQQRLLNAENLAGKTVVFSVWVRNNTSTPNNNAVLRIEEFGTGAGTNDNSIANLDDNWRRLTVQRKLSAGVTDVSVQIRSAGTITYYFAHAHVLVGSEGTYNLTSVSGTAITGPYVETQGTPYQAQGTWTWPDWLTQNGYLEADICFGETANPNNRTTIILGANSAVFTPTIDGGTVYRGSGDATASNIIRSNKTSDAGTAGPTYTPASSLFDGAYHKYRAEWVNYTIAGTRTIQFRLYVDGVLQGTNSPAATTWARPPALFASHQGTAQSFQTMKNIKIGSPVIPPNATPEPY
ncbi:MAG: hypothetical protein EBX40_00120 [Gammaproteobacteria bacterium]|nr:hypothetical protein [Gammaproteobacteria bacterium]